MMEFKKITSFEEACHVLGISAMALPDVSFLNQADADHVVSHYMLTKITEAINGDWKADYTNCNQRKYWPYFWVGQNGGFSFDDCGFDYSFSSVGNRLCFGSREAAEYAGFQFTHLYKRYHLGISR